MKQLKIMSLSKKLVVCICGAVLFSGCTAQKSTVVPPPLKLDEAPPIVEHDLVNPDNSADESKKIILPNQPDVSESPADNGQVLPVQGPLPSMDYVNDRIFEYGRKLERWKQIDASSSASELSSDDAEVMVNCFKDLRKVLNGYNQLRGDMLHIGTSGQSRIIGSDEVMDLQKSDISFLESICGKILAPAEDDQMVNWEHREAKADLPQLETLIERYNGSKEYEEVVQVWQQIPEKQRDRVHLRTKILYGNALMYLHQEERAAAMYKEIVDEMAVSDKQRTDLLSLRKLLADLYTASGNFPAAKTQYNNIASDYTELGKVGDWSSLQLDILDRSDQKGPELATYSNLLRDYLGFIPERDGFKVVWDAEAFLKEYPYSAVASNVDIIKKRAQEKAQKWFDGFFSEVDELANQKKYLDAIQKLETIPDDIINKEQKETIKEKSDQLELAEAVDRETRKIAHMKDLEKKWNEGLLKVNEGTYDDAITIFQGMLQSEYKEKAQDKIKEVRELAAKTERRNAANLYTRFTKTTDVEAKKKLLIESRRLLVGILAKYPDSSITDKVQANIQRVEQEMNLLDPTLLPEVMSQKTEVDNQQNQQGILQSQGTLQ